VTAFASIMVFLVALMMFQTPSTHHGVGPDLPRVDHPIPMPDANREDAMLVAIMRDGTVFFGNEHVPAEQLTAKIRERLSHHVLSSYCDCWRSRELQTEKHSRRLHQINDLNNPGS